MPTIDVDEHIMTLWREAAREWARTGGVKLMLPLGLTYVAAFGGSHPLAKKIGPWPSVAAVTAIAAGTAAAFADRP